MILQPSSQQDPQYPSNTPSTPKSRPPSSPSSPFVHILCLPIRLFFSLVENFFLFTILLIHKIFSWLTIAFYFIFQALAYGMLEFVVEGLLQTVDTAIVAVMPEWVPQIWLVGQRRR